MRSAAEEFRAALRARLQRATEAGEMSLEVRSGDLHRAVGGYPGTDHRMPVLPVPSFLLSLGQELSSARAHRNPTINGAEIPGDTSQMNYRHGIARFES